MNALKNYSMLSLVTAHKRQIALPLLELQQLV